MYIETTDDLRALVERLRASDAVAIDTEFMREKTYYARLCLMQIASDSESAIIDPLAFEDLSPLAALLSDTSVTKVFHAGDQDLEILYREVGVVPSPLFDTQKAASLLGSPQQVGYGALVKDVLDIDLEKGESFTDWSRRPLSAKQLSYAENDVTYLIKIYREFVRELEESGRMSWVRKDFERMTDASNYVVDPSLMWKKVKRFNSLSRRQLAVLREVAAWREEKAQERDVPRRWLFSDESLIEIARRMPQTHAELAGIRGVGDRLKSSEAKGILAAVTAGKEIPESELPYIPKRKFNGGDSNAIADMLMAVVRMRAKENQVSTPMLVSRDDLSELANGSREGLEVLTGWRYEMVGKELLEVLEGTVALRVSGSEIIVEKDK